MKSHNVLTKPILNCHLMQCWYIELSPEPNFSFLKKKKKLKDIEISIIVSFSWIHWILYKKFVLFRVLENSNPLVTIPIHTQICYYNFHLKKEKNLLFILFFLINSTVTTGEEEMNLFFECVIFDIEFINNVLIWSLSSSHWLNLVT